MLVVFQNTVCNRNESSQKKQATKQVRGHKKERGEEHKRTQKEGIEDYRKILKRRREYAGIIEVSIP